MPRRTPTGKRVGRKTALTHEVEDVILESVRNGNHLTVATATAGIAYATLWRWIEKADACEQAIAAGKPHIEAHLRYVEFRDRLTRARAKSEDRMVRAVVADAEGGRLISEEPVMEVVGGETRLARDDNGEILYKRTWSQPNGRTALAYLSRSAPERWGEKTRLELAMAGEETDPLLGQAPESAQVRGDAVAELEAAPDVSSLVTRLAQVARDRRNGVDQVVPPEEPVDAEIVDEG